MQKYKQKSSDINIAKNTADQQQQAKQISISTPMKKITKQYAEQISEKIAQQLKSGFLMIPRHQLSYDESIGNPIKQSDLKNIRNKKDDSVSNKSQKVRLNKLYQSSQEIKKGKTLLYDTIRKEQLKKQKEINENLKQSFLQKLRRWSEQKYKVHSQRQSIQLKKQALDISNEERKIKQQEQGQILMRQQKLKAIQAKLQQIQQRKKKRQKQLQQGSLKKSSSVPKFIEYLNTFKESEKQKQIQNQLMLQNKKRALQNYLQKVKQHQKAYVQKIKERQLIKSENRKKYKSQSSINKKRETFNIHKKNPVEVEKIEEKIQRIKKFDQKIKLIPLKINQQKRKLLEINGDKLDNFKKYNYLSHKAYSDEKIYNEFKDFDLKADKKQLGNKYLEEVKEFIKKYERKTSSQKTVNMDRKPSYKNYIEQVKEMNKRGQQTYKSCSFEHLLKQSQKYEDKVIENINDLKRMPNYHDSLKKQEEMDSNYLKAIRVKLAMINKI